MKIRNGFVSNSSSSSFYMFGAYIVSADDYLSKLIKDGSIVVEPKKEIKKQSGIGSCAHKSFDNSSMKFCPECGIHAGKMVVDSPKDNDNDPIKILPFYFRKMGLDCTIWDGGNALEAGLYIGMFLDNNEREPIKKMEQVQAKLKAICPNMPVRFYCDYAEGG